MTERLQKILSARGVASRRQAEILLQEGRVTCNGQVCKLGQTADPEIDEILVDGNPLPNMGKRVYILLNKPRGYVTTLSDEKGRKNVAQLVKDCNCRVYPVGRLDMDSEGLLLLTNYGEFANRLMHPRHEVDKIYKVTVTGYTAHNLDKLRCPIELDGYRIKTPQVKLLRCLDETSGKALLQVTIHEGRNRQVRRMCAAAGMDVQRLVRIQEGPLTLGEIPCGKWRYLTEEEVKLLQM